MTKFITAREAAELIQDGDTVASAGMAVMGLCEDVIRATEERFLESEHPKGLTLMYGAHQGDNPITVFGWDRWAQPGMIKRWIGSFLGASPKLNALCNENKMETYCLPFGTILQLYSEIGAGRPGLITKIGLQTYVDPRLEGAKMNSITTEDIVEHIHFKGEEWMFYRSVPINVGLIRGTTVDANGNLTFTEESINSEALALATAVKNSGGIVIAQAKYVALAESLHPRDVRVPGVLIDYVVVNEDPDTHRQNEAYFYNPALSGNIKANLSALSRVPLDDSKVIARRAAMELRPGDSVNLGIGIPQLIASIGNEERVGDLFTLTSESGTVGGVAVPGKAFGNAWNPECLMDMNNQFAWYDGGGLGIAFLGLAETDQTGNVNVSKFGTRSNGPGGFINITQTTKNVIFCGGFMAGKLKTEVKDGAISILQEGKAKKFIRKVGQVTFSGGYAVESGQRVLYITERCVFRLTPKGLELIEVAPGIDVERDILANMEFEPKISTDLKLMDFSIFHENWGGLRKILEEKK